MIRRRNVIRLIVSVGALLLGSSGAARILAQRAPQSPQPRQLKQRAVMAKSGRTQLNNKVQHDVVVVKFREGTHIRQRLDGFDADLSNLSQEEESKLNRVNLAHQAIFTQLDRVNRIVGRNAKRLVKRMFDELEDELIRRKRDAESSTLEEFADLNLYFYILIADAKVAETEAFIDELNSLDIVEIAYAQPIPEPANVDVYPPTLDYTGLQGYLYSAAGYNGIDAVYAWSWTGGRGKNVRTIDVEQGWNLAHEDAPAVFVSSGDYSDDRSHGTAGCGVLAAASNNYGVTGIASDALVGVSSALGRDCNYFLGFAINCWTTYDFAHAVYQATKSLVPGDVILIEQHTAGPKTGRTCTCNCGQFEYVPMEYYQANFDAIKYATAAGIVVVEAAGNGSTNLDFPVYNNLFSSSFRDSGAILVGGGSSSGRVPMCWTNYGSRLDVQGWGENVATIGGYGEIKVSGSDQNQVYTTQFAGTSSGSAVVAGAVTALQGYLKGRCEAPYDAVTMRSVLAQTGTPQPAGDYRAIGPLPNLRSFIDSHRAPYKYSNCFVIKYPPLNLP